MCKLCDTNRVREARRVHAPDEPVKKPQSKKDTKTWCRGKVGAHHEPTWKRETPYPWQRNTMERYSTFLSCDVCGKRIGWKTCSADWTPDDIEYRTVWHRRRYPDGQPPCVCRMHPRFKVSTGQATPEDASISTS